jgi:hypothetical protein
LNFDFIQTKIEEGGEFEVAIANVSLASSLKMSISLDSLNMGIEGNNANSKKPNEKVSTMTMIADMAMAISSERSTAVNLVLSMMVLSAAIVSLRFIGMNTYLLYLFSILLSLYNCNVIVRRVYAGETDAQKRICICMILLGHTFTSPDAPVKEPEDEIPKRFIDG